MLECLDGLKPIANELPVPQREALEQTATVVSMTLATIQEVARELKLPASWLREEAAAGRLPCLMIGNMPRFHLASLRNTLIKRAATEFHNPSEGPNLNDQLLQASQAALSLLRDLEASIPSWPVRDAGIESVLEGLAQAIKNAGGNS